MLRPAPAVTETFQFPPSLKQHSAWNLKVCSKPDGMAGFLQPVRPNGTGTASDPGLDAFNLLLAATHSAHHHHRPAIPPGRSSRQAKARVCSLGRSSELSLTAHGCPPAKGSQTLSSQGGQHRRRSKRLASNPETAQAGSTAAGSAVENGSRHGLNGHNTAVLELVQERKQEANGIEMMARNHPSQNGKSAAAERPLQNGSDTSNGMPIICAPEEFQLEPGAVSHVSPSQQNPLDVFRCSGCTRAECQVSYAIKAAAAYSLQWLEALQISPV